MSDPANALRGEVDLELDGTRFVLRPSYEAVLAMEKATGKSLVALATLASDGEMSSLDAGIVTTELIRAGGKSAGDQIAQKVDGERIGQLIHEFGLMPVQLRLSLVLMLAATGGCKADGTRKEGEVTPTTGTTATSGVGLQD